MSMTVNTNATSLMVQRNVNAAQADFSDTISRLSSGNRIINAKDDAAGRAISESMKQAVTGLNQANRNANDGVSLIETAESSMNEQLNNLQRMRELAVQSANGTYSTDDLAKLDLEFQALDDEINRLANTASFNGTQLLDGTTATVTLQIGDKNNANNQQSVTLADTTSATLAINALDVTSQANAQTAMDSLDTAIGTITSALAQLGADHSNLESAIRSNGAKSDATSQARSRIADADFALESSNLAKNQILQQASISMLAQANASNQGVLSLLG